ncbi:MAG: polyamine aminopropyltransferase [Myxococcota bacterium]
MMSKDTQAPASLRDGGEIPECHGFVEGNWYVEETAAAVRQSFRVNEILHSEDTKYQHLEVLDTPFFGRVMTLDGLVMLTERDEFVYHEMLIHVPLCSLRDPKRVLIIGGGDCGCLREALKHPGIEEVVQVDIDRRVTEVSAKWFDWVEAASSDPRATLLFEDGVRYIREHPRSFDLIVVDSTDPKGFALDLFMEDFYRQVADALKPGGVMTAQTESPHWSTDMVGAIYEQLRGAFPHVSAYLACVPTYASGLWTLAYASSTPRPAVDTQRSELISAQCRYYNTQVHEGAFALPNFVRDALEGENVFSAHDARVKF